MHICSQSKYYRLRTDLKNIIFTLITVTLKMIVTSKRHLVYKSHKNIYIYIYVFTKNYGSCKILIARY